MRSGNGQVLFTFGVLKFAHQARNTLLSATCICIHFHCHSSPPQAHLTHRQRAVYSVVNDSELLYNAYNKSNTTHKRKQEAREAGTVDRGAYSPGPDHSRATGLHLRKDDMYDE